MEAIVQRDVRDVAQIEQIAQMPRLLRILAEHSGQLVNYSGIGAAIGMNHVTTQKYVAYSRAFPCPNSSTLVFQQAKRLTKTPKIQFLDSGLSHLCVTSLLIDSDITGDSLVRLLETFVFGRS